MDKKEKETKYKDYTIFSNNEETNTLYQKGGFELEKMYNENFDVNNDNDDEDDIDELSEGVERIKIIEKTVKNKTTGLDQVICKKIIFYTDGNSDVIIYKKN